MNKINENRTGYKKTKVGWIPEEWNVESISKAFNICNNLRLPISETERKKIQGDYPYYGPTKIQDYINEYRVDGTYALIGEDGDHFLKWKDLPMTLLVSGKFNVNNHAHIIQGKENLTEWFFYYFNHRPLTPHLTRQGAGRYKLTKDALGKIPCAVPSTSEQHAIATCLTIWDKAITTIQKLIEQKEQQKKWLMQNLFTGKKRLKGFSDVWEQVKVGECIQESRIPARNNSVEYRIKVKLNLNGIEHREVKGTESKDATTYYHRKAGQFIYGKQNLHKGAFGIIPEKLDGFNSSQDIPTFDFTEKVNPQFFFLYLCQINIYKSLEKYATGTGSKRIHPESISNVKYNFPPLIEQGAIVEVLHAANKEIEKLKRKLDKFKEQKKGLMQQLLTGAKRLNINN